MRDGGALPAGLGLGALGAVLLGDQVGGAGKGALAPVGLAVTAARLASDALGAAGIGLGVVPLLLASRIDRASTTARGRARMPAARGQARPGTLARDRDRRAAYRDSARLGVLAGAGWASVALLGWWLQAANAGDQSPFAVSPRLLGGYAARVAAGRGLLLTLGCAVALMALQLASLRGGSVSARSGGGSARLPYAELVVGVGLLGVLAGPLTGHATGSVGHDPAVLAIALHVAAASAWVGGLLAVVMVLAGRRRLLAEALPRFSTLAGYCAGVVAVSGVVSAALRLPVPGALVSTGYGELVLAKAACLIGLLGLGWRARRGLLPRLTSSSTAPAGLMGWLGFELALMAVVFGLAAAVASAPPA